MSKELVSDELWEIIKPLLPEEPPKPNGGRPRIDDRAALTGIVFVLKSGIPWEMLPQEMGCGSGSTCWRRLRDWQEAGVWEELHQALLDRLGQADRIDWERASLDSASVPAKSGAKAPRCFGPRGHPARGSPQRCQRPRLEGAGGGGGRHFSDPQASWAPRQAAQASREAARRQGIRLPSLQASAQEEGHNPPHLPPGDRL